MANIRLPQSRPSAAPRTTKTYDNTDAILKVMGQNPFAQAIDQVTPLLAQALQRRQELRQQAQQVAQVESAYGMQPGRLQGLPLQTASSVGKDLYDQQQKATQGGGDEEYKRKSLEIREKMLGLRQQAMDFSKQKLTLPTAQIRSMGETAVTVIPHIDELSKTIHEAAAKGYVGPVSGRIYNDFLAGQVGTTGNSDADALLGKLRAEDSLVKTAMLRTHFGARGGQQMYDHFASLLNTGKQSEEEMQGALGVFKDFANGYAQAGGVNQANFNAGGAASFDPNTLRVPRKPLAPLTMPGQETPAQRKARLLNELSGAR